ncbi:MAG: response regulator [Chitinophagaceae bacterium]
MSINKQDLIFIVDDDLFWSNILHQLLISIGYNNIKTYENGLDCVNNLSLSPKVIFLDYQMNGKNGLEVLKEINTQANNFKIIFCTAHEDLSVAMGAMQGGSFDYLLKNNATEKEIKSILEKIN